MIDKEDMVAVRENLKHRYELGDTVPGTMSCHHCPNISIHHRGKTVEYRHKRRHHSFLLDIPAPQSETLV